MSQELVQHYADGAEKLSLAIRGLTDEDMSCPPDPAWNAGKWSIAQVAVHIADAEGVIADRMKRVIAEDNPTLLAFDEEKWASRLRYESQSANDAARMVELTRKQLATILRQLPQDDFNRSGTHSQKGKLTLADLVKFAASHLEHHVKFIHEKRARMGKEMW